MIKRARHKRTLESIGFLLTGLADGGANGTDRLEQVVCVQRILRILVMRPDESDERFECLLPRVVVLDKIILSNENQSEE